MKRIILVLGILWGIITLMIAVYVSYTQPLGLVEYGIPLAISAIIALFLIWYGYYRD